MTEQHNNDFHKNKPSQIKIDSQSVVYHALSAVFNQSIWELVAQHNVQRMAPQCAFQQCQHILHSFVQMQSQSRDQSLHHMNSQCDPKPSSIDTLAVSSMHSQQKLNQQQSQAASRKLSQAYLTARLSTNRSFNQKVKKQNAEIQNRVNNSSSAFLTKIPALQEQQIDSVEQKYRTIKARDEADKKTGQQFMLIKQAESQQRMKRNEKLLKDLKKYTFDYQGDIWNVKKQEGQDRITLNKMKSGFSQNSPLPKQFIPPITENIENQKQNNRKAKGKINIKQKFEPIFNQEGPKSILQTLAEQAKISQGVRFTETINNQKISKQTKKPKIQGIGKYHLNEFKDFSKQKRFKQHKYLSKRSVQSIPSRGKVQSRNIQSNQLLTTQKSATIDVHMATKQQNQQNSKIIQGYGALPPLQRGLARLRTKSLIKGSEKSFDLSRTSKASNISKITVENSQLYDQNFMIKFQSRGRMMHNLGIL